MGTSKAAEGNLGSNSGTGVAFTRDPATGEWEQGFAVYNPNTDKTEFKPVEGEIMSPEEEAELKLKYQKKYDIRTDEAKGVT